MRIFQVKELGNGDLELKPEGLDSRTHDISFFFFFPLNLVILAEIEKKHRLFISGGAGSWLWRAGLLQSW